MNEPVGTQKTKNQPKTCPNIWMNEIIKRKVSQFLLYMVKLFRMNKNVDWTKNFCYEVAKLKLFIMLNTVGG
jgi:hypothetical protein